MRPRRPRTQPRPRLRTLALLASAALAATTSAVAVGVAVSAPAQSVQAAPTTQSRAMSLGTLDLDRVRASRELRVSRDLRVSRTAPRVTLLPRATGHRFATGRLEVRAAPGERARRVGAVDKGSRLAVTGQVVGHWAEVLMAKHAVRWVNARGLSVHKPRPPQPQPAASTAMASDPSPASTGISSAPCPDGSAIEAGLTSNADRVYRAVCAVFPQPTTYGGYDPHGEHADGRAIDIMITGSVGWQIAEWLRAHAGELAVRDIIYSQRIWTPERAAEGWRYMSDRGSTTANHYDHVHVAVY